MSVTKVCGITAEKSFVAYVEKCGWVVDKGTHYEDCYEHIDYWLTRPGLSRQIAVEVKSAKALHRGDNAQDTWLWVESVGINGHDGWLYGRADIFAFQQVDGTFMCVYARSLRKYINRVMFNAPGTNNASDARGRWYTRYNRRDKVTLVRSQAIAANTNLWYPARHLVVSK